MKGLGKKYSEKASDFYSWKYLDKPALIKVLPNIDYSKAKIIDLGCGSGRSLEILENKSVEETNLYGLDSDTELLEQTKYKYPKMHLIKSDIRKLPVKNHENKYDLIYSVHTLHYFTKKELNIIFKKVFKLLKSNGFFIFLVSHPLRWVDDLDDYFSRGYKKIETYWGTELKLYMNTISDYSETLCSNGFIITRLLEPTPIDEGNDNKKLFNKYSSTPSRLLIVSKKNAHNL